MDIKPIPDCVREILIQRAADKLEEQKGYYRPTFWLRGIYEEITDGRVYCWAYDYDHTMECPEFVFVAVISKTGKTVKTFDGERWGKRCINPQNAYGLNVIHINHLVYEKYGKDVEDIQDEESYRRYKAKNGRKAKKIKDMVKQEKPIPKRINQWMHSMIKHFIIFDTSMRNMGWCTNCAAQIPFNESLKNAKFYECPRCHTKVEARTIGKVPSITERSFVFPQKIKNGIMVRCVILSRYNVPGSDESQTELIRTVLQDGKQDCYEKRAYYDYCNPNENWLLNKNTRWTRSWMDPDRPAYVGRKHAYKADYYHEVWGKWNNWSEWKKLLNGASIGYVFDEFREGLEARRKRNSHPYIRRVTGEWFDEWDICRAYQVMETYPQIESLYKIGLSNLATDLIVGMEKKEHDPSRRELHKFLGISKELFRVCTKDKEITKHALYMAKKCEINGVPVPLCRRAAEVYTDIPLICEMKSAYHHSHRKIIRYLEKIGKVQATTWKDYLMMARAAGADLTSEFVFFPKNVEQAHDAYLAVKEEADYQEMLIKNRKTDEAFKKATKKNRKLFTFKTDNYIIRPAETVSEIIKEGQAQHNCVGRLNYADKMKEGKTMILFLRKRGSENESYYTVETDMGGRLRQAYAKYNKKTEDYDTTILPILKALERKVQMKNEKYHAAG